VSPTAPLLLAHGASAVLAHGGDVPPFTAVRLVSGTDLLQWPTLLLLAVAALYLYGVQRLARRGHHWPLGRTLVFLLGGLGSIAIATVSGLAAYDDVLFSAHMVQHMVLLMVAPIFLALGAPVTLALRTLPRRPRAWLLALLHSRFARVLTFPLVGFALFAFSSYALYFTGWYEATLRHDWLHELLHVHFLVIGCVFFWPLVGLDPVPGRVAYPFRALLMFASLPFHAILGLTVMQSSTLIAGDYYRSLHLGWVDPVHDQLVGGGLLWASGDAVGLLMFAALVVQWMRASEREAEREDRRLDRLEAQQAAAAARGGAGPPPRTISASDLRRSGPR
jgi:cytochrome c oxidase assembly factor CtaG